MFPPNLQKNIQELERQISLLETECEHMEAEKQEFSLSGKSSSKSTIREFPNQPFITGPSATAGSYSSKMLSNLPSAVPKIYSASCAHFRTTNEKFSRASSPKCPEESRISRYDSKPPEKPEETSGETTPCHEEVSTPERKESTVDQHANDKENKKGSKRSINSIKEVSESSEENNSHVQMLKSKQKITKETPQPWCELLREQSPPGKWQERSINKINEEDFAGHNILETKQSSDEDFKREFVGGKSKSLSGNWLMEYDTQVSQGSRLSSKRRPRSARTKRNSSDEIPVDLNMTKVLMEKETQCALWNEEKEKDEFFAGLHESVKIMHFLIGELKTKLSREKREDILKDMQNTLLKLSGYKTAGSLQKPLLTTLTVMKDTGVTCENEENVIDVKQTLLSLKQFCQQLSDEKTAMTEEIAVKNRTVANFKNKEKEYLSLISSLKFNLEKMKEEADEGVHAKRDLKILKIKLQEETKVIEALKKSHEKMQELIENYVLENDKLRAQVKIAKLESQKYNVLLAGKEADINKYRKEIESFQKQITEQLSLLRSKATENEVEQAIDAISNQRNKIQTEVECFRNQLNTSFNGNDFNANLEIAESSMTITKRKNDPHSPPEAHVIEKTDWENQANSMGEGRKPKEGNPKAVVFTSSGAEPEIHSAKRQFGLERVLSSSKNLRSSINELLEDIRKESSDMYWLSPSNSCLTSSHSALVTTSSDDVSEGDQNN